jgi:hypothetical protein
VVYLVGPADNLTLVAETNSSPRRKLNLMYQVEVSEFCDKSIPVQAAIIFIPFLAYISYVEKK